MIKFFNKQLFKENDTVCRKQIKKIFKNTKLKVVDNIDRYGVDILVYYKDKHVANFELERRFNVFENGNFKYDLINYPERKEKYLSLDKPTYFISFSEDLKNFLIVRDKDIKNSAKEVVSNKFIYNKEKFFKVKIEKAIKNDINELIKEICK